MISRRSVLGLGGAAALVGALPRTARALGQGRHLVVVFAAGGWDTTTVFDPKPGSAGVSMTPGDWADFGPLTLWNARNLGDDARTFLREHAGRMAIINGVAVNSLVHETCTQMVLTGQVGDRPPPDIAARVAVELGATLPLPYLAASTLARPGELAASAGSAGNANQLSSLLVPDFAWPAPDGSPAPGWLPDATTRARVDTYLKKAHAALAAERDSPGINSRKLADWAQSLERAERMRAHTAAGGLLSDPELFLSTTPWRRAARALAEGFSTSVFVQDQGYWDTHGGNPYQPTLHTDLFRGVGQLLYELDVAGIRDQTVVLVVSEMGRTPNANQMGGKDHWPFTSSVIIGSDVRPTVVRGTDDGLVQRPVSLASGDPDPDGRALGAPDVLATVAHLVGLDARDLYPDAEVIRAIVA